MTELEQLADRLGYAESYLDIFPDQDTIQEIYRKLSRVVHPDMVGFGQAAFAAEAFKMLNEHKRVADQMAADGRYGEPLILATIKTRHALHQVKRPWGEDSLTQLYRATTTTVSHSKVESLVRVAKSAKDNDLLAAETKALKKLCFVDDKLVRHYPVLLDTFMHSEGRRRANVTEWIPDTYTLQQIRDAHPSGLDPRHGVWIFRRLMMALGFAHEQGLVHGAVVPTHVMIEPVDHAVVLVDWCYSQVIDEESKTNFIKAVVPMYTALYAPEVFAKEQPSAATDIYMAARLMNWLMPVAPKPLRNFFKGCALTKQASRPQNAWLLLKEFDDLLKHIGEPFYPKRFVEFAVPVGIA